MSTIISLTFDLFFDFEINILNILNIFTEIIGMAPPINVQDWYGDRHTCQIASGALGGTALIKCLDAYSVTTDVIKITIPKNGGHFERRAAIGRRNTAHHSYVAVSGAQ